MKSSYRSRYVRVRVLNKLTKSGYPVVLDYSNGSLDRYKHYTGIYIKYLPKKFSGTITQQHSPDFRSLQVDLDREIEKMNTAISRFQEEYGRRPKKDELKNWLRKPFDDANKRLYRLNECFNAVYDYKYKTLKNPKSADNYKSLAFAISDYSNRRNRIYTLDDIDEVFLEDFMTYLLFYKPVKESVPSDVQPKHILNSDFKDCTFDKKYGMCNNTLIKRMHTFITILETYSSISNTQININKIRLDINTVKDRLEILEYNYLKPTLSYSELELLASDDFKNHIQRFKYKRWENGRTETKYVSKDKMVQVRDTFILSAVGGSRFSDVVTMTPRNLDEGTKVSEKTRITYNVVTNDFIKSIYSKYDYNLKLSNHRYNMLLKAVFNQFSDFFKDELGNQQHYWKIEKRGKYIFEKKFSKWEIISSHTGRRSFATMARLEFEIPTEEVRNITGHASDRMLDKYVQVNQSNGYKKISQIMDFKNE